VGGITFREKRGFSGFSGAAQSFLCMTISGKGGLREDFSDFSEILVAFSAERQLHAEKCVAGGFLSIAGGFFLHDYG